MGAGEGWVGAGEVRGGWAQVRGGWVQVASHAPPFCLQQVGSAGIGIGIGSRDL